MDQYQAKAKAISKELSQLSSQLEYYGVKNPHIEARWVINMKYGKFWRERLDMQSVIHHPESHTQRFTGISYS